MKYQNINQASGNTFNTKPCRNRHGLSETVTLLHHPAADGSVGFVRCQVNRTVN